jgi:hypothetical protein
MKITSLIKSATWNNLHDGLCQTQRKATMRTLGVGDVIEGLLSAESMLDAKKIPAAERVGTTCEISGSSAHDSKRAPALSTYVRLLRRSREWAVTKIGRKVMRPPAIRPKLVLSSAAVDLIKKAQTAAPAVPDDGQLSLKGII